MAGKQKTTANKNDALTDKQWAFVLAYVECLNATEAAALAEYQGSRATLAVIGFENLRKPKIKAAINKLLNERLMSANEVLDRLSSQARGIPGECFRVAGPLVGVDLEKLKEKNLLHLIKKFSYDKNGKLQSVEFYDSQTALAHLGKYHALFVERTRQEDWRTDAIEYIRRGEISFEALADEFDEDLATELFRAAGVPIQVGSRTNQNGG